MKRKLAILSFLLFFISCEKPVDCIKSTGQIRSKVFDGLAFDNIIVNKGIGLVITQGDTYKVEVKAGENLINDIEVKVTDGTLRLEDNTSCNWTREYGATIVYVTAPNLNEIYSKTEKPIISNGELTFPNLRLIAMDDYDGINGIATGDWIIEINNQNLTIDCNNVSGFFITGTVDNAHVNFYESGGIFHGEQLLSNDISVYHRGTNNLIVHPIHSLKGDIYNIGNVISVTRPPVVEVNRHYKGQLIFY